MEPTKSNAPSIIISVIITALIVGGGAYFWQQQKGEQTIDIKLDDVAPVETQVKIPQLPVVYIGSKAYETESDLTRLQERLIAPYTDYHNEKEINFVSLHISPPANIGEEYKVEAIFVNGGYEGFLFGKKGEEYNYWKPACLGECPFSDAFKKKYPQIVEESNSSS